MARESKNTVEPRIKLSPREVDQLIQDALKKAKLTRLKQVREQSAHFAECLSHSVEGRRRREMAAIRERVSSAAKQRLKVTTGRLEAEVLECLTQLGKAHTKAKKEDDPRIALNAHRLKNERLARVRGQRASEIQRNEQLRVLKERNTAVETRRRALEVELVRSAHIVAMAPPPASPEKPKAKLELPKAIYFDKKSLFQSEYTPTDIVVKEEKDHVNAREAAEFEERTKLKLEREQARRKHEAEAKIVERGRAALSKERVHLNYLRLLNELDKLESKENHSTGTWELPSTSSVSEKSTTAEDFGSALDRSSRNTQVEQESEELPVRDQPVEKDSNPELPKLTPDCAAKLQEIGHLLEQLREEREHFMLEDQKEELPVKLNSETESIPSSRTEDPNILEKLEAPAKMRLASPMKEKLLSKKLYDLDGGVRVGLEVLEKTDSSFGIARSLPEKEKEKIPKILEAIRRERKQLEGVLLSQKKLSTPQQVPSSLATSTPVERIDPAARKRDILKHYVVKLLNMRREQVPQVSVNSSSSGSSLPLGADAFIFAPPETPKSSLRSSRSSQNSSRPPGSSEESPALTLNPMIDVYNQVYEAFNKRTSLLKQQVSSLRQERQRLETTPEESTFESLHLSQTTTDFSRSVQDSWTNVQSFSKQGFESSTSSELPERDLQTDVSSEISMPDVDAALRRLGLPSMQTVLRR